MKALAAAAAVLLALCAGTASASAQRHPSLHALNLRPPIFRGSGFEAHERVTVSLRGLRASPRHVKADARGRFRVRLGAVPSCRAWAVRALGTGGEVAVYRHSRCAAHRGDVSGVVRRGPIMSVCVAGVPCSAPAGGVTVQALKAGNLAAETTTNDSGEFSFSLPDGVYMIRALGRGTEPQLVHVETSNLVHLDFMIDTGIR